MLYDGRGPFRMMSRGNFRHTEVDKVMSTRWSRIRAHTNVVPV